MNLSLSVAQLDKQMLCAGISQPDPRYPEHTGISDLNNRGQLEASIEATAANERPVMTLD